MLAQEYSRVAKSVDKISLEQTHGLIGSMLDRLKRLVGANIAAVWIRKPGWSMDVLEPFVDRGDGLARHPLPVSLNSQARGLFAWVAEKNAPLWLPDVPRNPESLTNCLPKYEVITERFVDLYHLTRSFAAVPIEYMDRQIAVLALEASVPGTITDLHVGVLQELAKPTGTLIRKSAMCEEIRSHTEQLVEDFRLASPLMTIRSAPYRTGFLARRYDLKFHLVGKIISDTFRSRSIRAATYEHTPGKGLVVGEMLAQIASCHFGIADVTSLSSNVMFELGALIAANKPVVILRDQCDEATLPFDIAGYQCFKYAIESNGIFIRDPVSMKPIEDFIEAFIQERLTADADFRDAREWPRS